jgi:hypothetical protein
MPAGFGLLVSAPASGVNVPDPLREDFFVLVLRRPDFANRQSWQPTRAESYVGQAVLVLETAYFRAS